MERDRLNIIIFIVNLIIKSIYDAKDNVIGIEILGISKRVPLEMLKSL